MQGTNVEHGFTSTAAGCDLNVPAVMLNTEANMRSSAENGVSATRLFSAGSVYTLDRAPGVPGRLRETTFVIMPPACTVMPEPAESVL